MDATPDTRADRIQKVITQDRGGQAANAGVLRPLERDGA
jgi:hypothetical protein